MTRELWIDLALQLLLALLAVALCVTPLETPKAVLRVKLGSLLCFLASLGISASTFAFGLWQTFVADGPANEKAAQLATGITTLINGVVLAVPFGALCGVALIVRLARRPLPNARHP